MMNIQQLKDASDLIFRQQASAGKGWRYKGAWIYAESVAVFDFVIFGQRYAFDFELDRQSLTQWRATMLSRGNGMGALPVGPYQQIEGNRIFIAQVDGADRTPVQVVQDLCRACQSAIDYMVSHADAVDELRLADLLSPDARPVIADVGANPVDSPTYETLLSFGLCDVIGFEPQADAYARLVREKTAHERYYPVAVGPQGSHALNIYKASGFTSLFDIDRRTIDVLGDPGWRDLSQQVGRVEVDLTPLDDIPDLPDFDLLKIDIQGGELGVFQSGVHKLKTCLCVITEVPFFPLYEGAPSFGEVDIELQRQGFYLHKFIAPKAMHLAPGKHVGADVTRHRNQLIDGDAVYLKDIRDLDQWSVRALKVLVMLAHFVFDSRDLALLALTHLAKRKAVSAADVTWYRSTQM